MKKAEIILGSLAIISLILNLLNITGGMALTVLSLSAISVLYMYLSFALFNGIRLKKIFKKESYHGISTMRIVGAVLVGFALAVTAVGLLFKFQSWPGASINLGAGLFSLIIGFIVCLIKFQKTKADYFKIILKRIAIYGGLGLILMILPNDTWLEIRHSNHPEYIKAVKKARAEPNNEELWDKVDEERQKMNQEN